MQANKKLRLTYHVGEDFLDIVDGLRAIDEVLLFVGWGVAVDWDMLWHWG